MGCVSAHSKVNLQLRQHQHFDCYWQFKYKQTKLPQLLLFFLHLMSVYLLVDTYIEFPQGQNLISRLLWEYKDQSQGFQALLANNVLIVNVFCKL